MEGSVALPLVPTGGCPVMRAGRKRVREALQGGPCWGLLGPCLETSPSKVNTALWLPCIIRALALAPLPRRAWVDGTCKERSALFGPVLCCVPSAGTVTLMEQVVKSCLLNE